MSRNELGGYLLTSTQLNFSEGDYASRRGHRSQVIPYSSVLLYLCWRQGQVLLGSAKYPDSVAAQCLIRRVYTKTSVVLQLQMISVVGNQVFSRCYGSPNADGAGGVILSACFR